MGFEFLIGLYAGAGLAFSSLMALSPLWSGKPQPLLESVVMVALCGLTVILWPVTMGIGFMLTMKDFLNK